MQAKLLTGLTTIGFLVGYFVVRVCNDLNNNQWNLNLSATNWANKSVPYLVLEVYTVSILDQEMLRILFASFYFLVLISSILVTTVPETIMLVAGFCWMETVNKYKKRFKQDDGILDGNEVYTICNL